MHAYTGFWTRAHFEETHRKQVAAEKAAQAAARKAHRKLSKRARLLADLMREHKLFKRAERMKDKFEMQRRLRRYNRVSLMLDKLVDAA
jgi:hypothetical protein